MELKITSCNGCYFAETSYAVRGYELYFCKLMPGAPSTINEDREADRISLDCPIRKHGEVKFTI